ncbi:hypothetical protein NNJEOMEG_02821 [Fundidesulfovibrio magnetotacticus]|uniref:Uncharacterized protein n=1 Tax=Fundidesulfovibrio magnetotacticus TaxID=2730080 RepID=A0A6V8LR59_9BACT|nr:hypothetical protein [Fundidesulfovibrio magnetotacticus]GFK94973.1 hypothetical protein NNJEOMEG_02821 [Fundidesulfovibrio magnetotacticus]
MEHTEQIAQALDLAREAAHDIRALEAQALAALHERGDKETHRLRMAEKCERLADLAEAVEPLLDGGDETAQRLLHGLRDFARRANMALDLESIFFMGALLYPEDYQDGDPNDLERFILRFE